MLPKGLNNVLCRIRQMPVVFGVVQSQPHSILSYAANGYASGMMSNRVLLLCFLFALPVWSGAQSVSTSPLHPCSQKGLYTSWLDRSHDWMSRRVCGPSRWVDGFFVNDSEIYMDGAGSQLRIIGASRWQDNDDDGQEVLVRARVELPNAERRLSLIFRNDDDEADELGNDLDSRPEDVGRENAGFRAALRWVVDLPERMNFDIDAGLRSEIKTFVRARYRWYRPLPRWGSTFRFTQKGYWEDPEGFGASSLFELDKPLSRDRTLRFASEYELTEENNEAGRSWQFNQSASLYQRLGTRTGISYSISFDGFTQPVSAVETWRSSVRFRQSVWRNWFFYEVEPFVFWPRDEGYKGFSGIVLRLEVQAGLPQDARL